MQAHRNSLICMHLQLNVISGRMSLLVAALKATESYTQSHYFTILYFNEKLNHISFISKYEYIPKFITFDLPTTVRSKYKQTNSNKKLA